MALNIESKLETAWKTLLAAETYITAQSIPVYSYHDVSHEKPQKCVVVRAMQAENEASVTGTPGGIYKVEMEIAAISYIPDDASRSTLNAIYQAVLGIVTATSKTSFNTQLSGLVCAGWSVESGEQGEDDRVQYLTTKLTMHVY